MKLRFLLPGFLGAIIAAATLCASASSHAKSKPCSSANGSGWIKIHIKRNGTQEVDPGECQAERGETIRWHVVNNHDKDHYVSIDDSADVFLEMDLVP